MTWAPLEMSWMRAFSKSGASSDPMWNKVGRVTKEGRRSVDSLPVTVSMFLVGEFAGRCFCACQNNKVLRATSLRCCFMMLFGCPRLDREAQEVKNSSPGTQWLRVA